MKKISKVIVYYEDGTYEEVKASVPDSQGKQNKETISPSPVTPDFRPDTQKVQEWKPTPQPPWNPGIPYQPWYQPYTSPGTGVPNWRPGEIWCTTDTTTTDNIPLNYTIKSDTGSWSFTSTGNADNLNKYTITSTGNGNVDLSK